jgi:hypothetical protein
VNRDKSTIWALAAALLIPGCGGDPTGPTPLILESEHYRFVSTLAQATPQEMEEGIALAEAHYADIVAIVGVERAPQGLTTVRLEGDVQDRGPYVDQGVVHMFRYSAGAGGYFGLLAHELAHTFQSSHGYRYQVWTWASWGFYEEGFAEFIAQTIDQGKIGFPFYGYPEDVIAGHWLVNDEDIPLQSLRERHQELNLPCEFQTYTLRASWFRFIDEMYGRQAVLDLMYSEVEATSQVVEGMLGVGLAQLDSDWEDWLLARYAAIPDADAVAQEFRDRFDGIYVCRAGADF